MGNEDGAPGGGAASGSAPAFDWNRPTVVALLYLLGWLAVPASLIGLILAYAWKGDAGGWERSLLGYLIDTFWLTLMIVLVGVLAMLALMAGGSPDTAIVVIACAALGSMIFTTVRSVRALVKAQRHQPAPGARPRRSSERPV